MTPQEIMENERSHYLHRAKYELIATRMEFKEIQAIYDSDAPQFVSAWAQWMFCARVYNLLKRIKLK